MRDIKVIQADISKLQAELEDAKVHVAKRDAAVHILENLGGLIAPSSAGRNQLQ